MASTAGFICLCLRTGSLRNRQKFDWSNFEKESQKVPGKARGGSKTGKEKKSQ